MSREWKYTLRIKQRTGEGLDEGYSALDKKLQYQETNREEIPEEFRILPGCFFNNFSKHVVPEALLGRTLEMTFTIKDDKD